VRGIDPLADPRWDPYVTAHPRATPAHLAAWSAVLSRAYRYRPCYLALEGADGRLRGVLPVAGKRGPVLGARLRSLPAVPGPVGPLGASSADEVALIAAACRMADEHAAPLHFRCRVADYAGHVAGLVMTPAQPSYLLDLPSDAADLRRGWRRQGNLARNLRKAEAAGLTARQGHDDDDLRAFHRLYVRNMAKHGAIPHSLRLFAASRDHLGPLGAFMLMLIEKDGTPVAATVSYVLGDALETTFAVSDERYSDLRPAYAVWWETIRAAIARGLRVMDFGGTPPGSQADFKVQWGTRQVPAFDYVYPQAQTPAPGTGRRMSSAPASRLGQVRGRVLSAVWQQAPPPIRRLAGELVYRYL
jgi:CelD/BcsL family acetyltransferase involved in cellulose biosynthesis